MTTPARRPRGRPRDAQSPASDEAILDAALEAFATHGYDGVSVRMLNRRLGVSHSLIAARFGSKEQLWYAAADRAFEPLAATLRDVLDPTLPDPVEQLRRAVRAFLLHAARHPELLGLLDMEGRQDTERLAYLYDTHLEPAVAPIARLLDDLVAHRRLQPISLRALAFLVGHGGAGPFTHAPLARCFGAAGAAEQHADLIADLLVRALVNDVSARRP